MKKRLLSFLFLWLHVWVHSQVPQRFSYQAVLRTANGQILASQPVSMRISLLQGSETGTAVYVETQNASTNSLGLISLQIGGGTVVSGNMSSINWASGLFFIKTETDPEGGINFELNGISQLLSVPYALYANSANPAPGTAAGQMLYWDGNAWVKINPGNQGQTLTFCDGVPTWGPCTGGSGSVTDVDGNSYNTVTIGTQVWMKENLKASKYRNGDAIPTNLDNAAWINTTTGAFAIYNNDAANNTTYGKLYNWYAVADPRGLCPAGWHVPTDHDWQILTKYLDPAADTTQCCSNTAGGKMKSTGTLQAATGYWQDPNTDATNSSGFTGLPGGGRAFNGPYFAFSQYGYWWSSTVGPNLNGWSRTLNNISSISYRYLYDYKTDGFSVRCLKD
jgi:uncharacterized protein (TIGR02145 family)